MKVNLVCKQCFDPTRQCDCPRPYVDIVGGVIDDIRHPLGQEGLVWFIPDETYIESLQVGDLTLDCFGKCSEVTGITHREGNDFVLFYTGLGHNGARLSGNLVAGRLVRTVPLSNQFTSHELDDLEYELARRLALMNLPVP